MRRIKLFGLALLVVSAFGVMTAASASALLPDISVTLGGSYPLEAEGELKSADLLETVSGSSLVGTLVKLKLSVAELSALGKFTADFTGVKEGKNPCKTETDSAETVLLTGEFHLVFLGLSTKKETLSVGILFLPTAFTVKCGEPEKTKIKIKAEALGKVTVALNTEVTEIGGILEGKAGKQNLTSYFNANEELVKEAFLLSNFGIGYEQSMEQVTGELKLKSGQMFEVAG